MKKFSLTLLALLLLPSFLWANSCTYDYNSGGNASYKMCYENTNPNEALSQSFCVQEQYNGAYSGVNVSYSDSFCQSEGPRCKVSNGDITIYYSGIPYELSSSCDLIDGTYEATPQISSTSPSTNTSTNSPQAVTLTGHIGTVFSATPTAAMAISAESSIPAASALLTQANSQSTITEDDGSTFTAKSNTLVTLHPIQQVDNRDNKKITLLRGTLESSVPASQKDYTIKTPLAELKIAARSRVRASTSTQFTTEYQQQGNSGTLTISVQTGSIEIIQRDGSVATLSAGQQTTLSDNVPRSEWVLPIDGDYIKGGQQNMLSWLEYPGASAYILEYTFPSPNFATQNPSNVEFSNQTILFNQYDKFDGLIVLNLDIPDLNGQVVEARIYAVDGNDNPLSESVASDKGTFTFN